MESLSSGYLVGKGGFISMEWQTRGLEALPRYVAISVKEFAKEPVREINHHHLNLTGSVSALLCMSLCHILRLTWQSTTTWYLEITELYALIALEARRWDQGVPAGRHARRGSASCSSPGFWHRLGSQRTWFARTSFQPLASAVRQHSPCVFTSPSFCANCLCASTSSYKNQLHWIGLPEKPHLN